MAFKISSLPVLVVVVCRITGASTSMAICTYILVTEIKPDGVTEACMVDQCEHMQKAGQQSTDKSSHQNIA
jgi:hypothetical protein